MGRTHYGALHLTAAQVTLECRILFHMKVHRMERASVNTGLTTNADILINP